MVSVNLNRNKKAIRVLSKKKKEANKKKRKFITLVEKLQTNKSKLIFCCYEDFMLFLKDDKLQPSSCRC